MYKVRTEDQIGKIRRSFSETRRSQSAGKFSVDDATCDSNGAMEQKIFSDTRHSRGIVLEPRSRGEGEKSFRSFFDSDVAFARDPKVDGVLRPHQCLILRKCEACPKTYR